MKFLFLPAKILRSSFFLAVVLRAPARTPRDEVRLEAGGHPAPRAPGRAAERRGDEPAPEPDGVRAERGLGYFQVLFIE